MKVKSYEDPVIKKYRKKRNNRKTHKALKITLSVFTFLAVAVAVIAMNFTNIISIFGKEDAFESQFLENQKFVKLDAKQNILGDLDFEEMTGKKTLNVLIYGIDKNSARSEQYSVFRPDTIMVASINLETNAVALISIPRDSRVSIYGRSGMDKINSCFYYGAMGKSPKDEYAGGIKCLKGTVEDLLGIKIHYYLGVDMSSVVKIVNTIGGVEVNVHTDVYVKGVRKIKKGKQVLNGTNFLRYARYRDYAEGDIQRTKVQQTLMKNLFSAVLDSKNVVNIASLVSQVTEMVDTDLKFDEMLALAMRASEFDLSKFKTATLPGNFLNLDGISYWEVSVSGSRTAFKNLIK